MPNITTRLGLKSPLSTDPFQTSDFVDNWTVLDGTPGVYVCLSSSRPSTWGIDQKGRTIVETDTGRQLMWDGASFVSLTQFPPATGYAYTSSTSISAGTTNTFILTTSITTTVNCTLTAIISTRLFKGSNTDPQKPTIEILIDDVESTVGGSHDFALHKGDLGEYNVIIPSIAMKAVTPGSHSLKVRLTSLNTAPDTGSFTFHGARAVVLQTV